MNKSDLLYDADSVMTLGDSVFISALHGNGIDALLAAIDRALPPDRRRCVFLFPYDDMSPSSLVREDSTVFGEEYTENGLKIDALCSVKIANKFSKYVSETYK